MEKIEFPGKGRGGPVQIDSKWVWLESERKEFFVQKEFRVWVEIYSPYIGTNVVIEKFGPS